MKDPKSLGTSGGIGLEMLKTSVAMEKNTTHTVETENAKG